ncbi:SGNH/GDSL hydrolase family protein [Streptomyces sp. NPDC048352]|uniref:SGNH/GDSL hydrolase family protein n=1 Tax=Streptomyces sp. NPDC048352 TaxID=3154718 RepID=UPI00343686A4
MEVSGSDPGIRWSGVVSLEHANGFVAPWRVPYQDTDLYFPLGGTGRAAMTSGVRFGFVTDSESVEVEYALTPPTYDPAPPELPWLDVFCDGERFETVLLERQTDRALFTVTGLPRGRKLVEFWLPVYAQMRIGRIRLAPGSVLLADESRLPAWTHYGCSISQGRGAVSPSRTFPAQLALAEGLDLTSVSMGGTCHLQPMFGRLVAGMPSELISLHVGSNIYYYGSLNRETLHGAVVGFVSLIRDRQPDVPVVVISPTYAPAWEAKPGPSRLTHKRLRSEIRNAMDWLLDRGDPRLHYIDGTELFGEADAEHFLEPPEREQVHFDPRGHDLVARRLGARFAELGVLPSGPARTPERTA